MLLLVFATIFFFKKFKTLAIKKGKPETKWGIIGAAIYLGVAFGFQFLAGILLALTTDIDLEDQLVNIIVSLLGYGIGALTALGIHNRWESKPGNVPDINEFGEEETLEE